MNSENYYIRHVIYMWFLIILANASEFSSANSISPAKTAALSSDKHRNNSTSKLSKEKANIHRIAAQNYSSGSDVTSTSPAPLPSGSFVIYKFPDRVVLSRNANDHIELSLSNNGALELDRNQANMLDLMRDNLTGFHLVDAIYGVYEFSYGSYLAVITASHSVESFLNPHARKVDEITLIAIPSSDGSTYRTDSVGSSSRQRRKIQNDIENLLLKTFASHSFYFSDSGDYDITRSYQYNKLMKSADKDTISGTNRLHTDNHLNNTQNIIPWLVCDEKFTWNYNLNQIFTKHGLYQWLTPVMNAWSSSSSCILEVDGKGSTRTHRKVSKYNVTLALVSRRSRNRQGPRYIKRGSDERGNVANFVMTEQLLRIIDMSDPSYNKGNINNGSSPVEYVTSFAQLRGSIPLVWSQPDIWKLKPNIVVSNNISNHQRVFNAHTFDLYREYISDYFPFYDPRSQSKDDDSIKSESSLPSSAIDYCKSIGFINLIDKKSTQGKLGQLLSYCVGNFAKPRNKKASNKIQKKSAPAMPFFKKIIPRISSIFLRKFFLKGSECDNGIIIENLVAESVLNDWKKSSSISVQDVKRRYTRKRGQGYSRTLADRNSIISINSNQQRDSPNRVTDAEILHDNIDLRYIWMDYHAKVKKLTVSTALQELFSYIKPFFAAKSDTRLETSLATNTVYSSYFCDKNQNISSIQSNILRTNCVDCLDRTNVVQTSIGRWMIIRQLKDLGIWSSNAVADDELTLPDENFEGIFRNIWCDNGDSLSLLYAGTRALKRDVTRIGRRTRSGAVTDGVNSMLRYYLNNHVDREKQRGLDTVLGRMEKESRRILHRARFNLFLSQRSKNLKSSSPTPSEANMTAHHDMRSYGTKLSKSGNDSVDTAGTTIALNVTDRNVRKRSNEDSGVLIST